MSNCWNKATVANDGERERERENFTVLEHLEEREGGDVDLLGGIEGWRVGRRVAQSTSRAGEHSLKPLHTGHSSSESDRVRVSASLSLGLLRPLEFSVAVNRWRGGGGEEQLGMTLAASQRELALMFGRA